MWILNITEYCFKLTINSYTYLTRPLSGFLVFVTSQILSLNFISLDGLTNYLLINSNRHKRRQFHILLLLLLSHFSHIQEPTRLPHLWDSPGKNTGVGCHFLLQCMKVKSEREIAQLYPTLSHLMDCSLPGSFIHRIFQARVLEWGAIAFSVTSM